MNIEEIVVLSVKHNAGDLHLCCGHLPMWRCDGQLTVIPGQQEVDNDQLTMLADRWLTDEQQLALATGGQVDFAVSLGGGQRLRAHFFQQLTGLSLALRLIARHCPSLDTLATPAIVATLLQQRDGLILITGATGSGKSTTLAAMTEALNQQRALHIITLEDPIEFIHRSQQALIQQRQIGQHFHGFSSGLRAALREDPDVILLGELRDAETIRLALTAAETGHLVVATLHTRGAIQAIERLVDVFSGEEKNWVRSQLAGSLQAVVAQRLVSRKTGGRVALFEILTNTPAVANLIRTGKDYQLPALLETGGVAGMQTFAQSLQERQQRGWL